jgi:formylglycine-generating enzyme required for sulfatase activity
MAISSSRSLVPIRLVSAFSVLTAILSTAFISIPWRTAEAQGGGGGDGDDNQPTYQVGAPVPGYPDLIVVDPVPEQTTLLPTEVQVKNTSLILRIVPKKSFTMGSKTGDKDEEPEQSASSPGAYLSKGPISHSEWSSIMGSSVTSTNYSTEANQPVTMVSYDEAEAFASAAAAATGEDVADKYGPPTELVWECAAQGGTVPSKTTYSKLKALDVNSGPTSETGFYHMVGNVFCWCKDDYDEKTKALRGGTWYIYNKSFRPSDRWNNFPTTKSPYIGVRLMRALND